MRVQRILPGLHELRLPGVNAFLLESESEGLTLVDTGLPGSAGAIIDAVHALGREASDLRQILVTHCHADHDAGTFQKILEEGKVTIYATETVMMSFLRN